MALVDHVLDKVLRQAVGIVQRNASSPATMPFAGRRAFEHVFQTRQAAGEDRIEALLLAADHLYHRLAAGTQLRTCLAELCDHRIREAVQNRRRRAEPLTVPHRPPHDLAEHVAAFLVRRDDAISDEKGASICWWSSNQHRMEMSPGSMVPRCTAPVSAPMAPRIGVKRSVS